MFVKQDDLTKEYNDPIAHFKEISKQKSKEDINESFIKNLKTKVICNHLTLEILGIL